MAAPLIAVIDHDPLFIRLMETLLTTEGYRVLAINDGTSAYEVLKRVPPDSVIVDTWLGERNAGWDLIQVLRLDPETATIPVLICSSDDPDDVKKKLSRVRHRIEMIHKPFDTEELLAAVRKTLDAAVAIPKDGHKPDARGE
jgi:DNA-binding response OmpR family regulator